MPIRGKMGQRMAVGAKHEMIEERLPGLALRRRPLGNRNQAQEQGGVGGVGPVAERVPPVIDEPIERADRLHLMPPQLRQIERIAG